MYSVRTCVCAYQEVKIRSYVCTYVRIALSIPLLCICMFLTQFVCIYYIAEPKLRDLVRLEVSPEWYSLGLQLGLTENVLNVIECDGRDVSTCGRKMFSKWLSSNKDANYTDLVDALLAIDKKDVAENVSQKFCKFCFAYTYYVFVYIYVTVCYGLLM